MASCDTFDGIIYFSVSFTTPPTFPVSLHLQTPTTSFSNAEYWNKKMEKVPRKWSRTFPRGIPGSSPQSGADTFRNHVKSLYNQEESLYCVSNFIIWRPQDTVSQTDYVIWMKKSWANLELNTWVYSFHPTCLGSLCTRGRFYIHTYDVRNMIPRWRSTCTGQDTRCTAYIVRDSKSLVLYCYRRYFACILYFSEWRLPVRYQKERNTICRDYVM